MLFGMSLLTFRRILSFPPSELKSETGNKPATRRTTYVALQPRRMYLLIIYKFSYFLILLFITIIHPFFPSFLCTIFNVFSFSSSSSPFYHSFPSPIIFPSLLIFIILSPLLRRFLRFLILFLLEHKYANAGTGVKNWYFIREVSASNLLQFVACSFRYFCFYSSYTQKLR
jgi:hypothetical protein